jgi:C-terminal processing protease CtpA/Prc
VGVHLAFLVGVTRPFALAALASLGVGCASFDAAVRERFTTAYTCPREAIDVTPRPDVKAHTLTVMRDDPPPDVVADAARMQLWTDRLANQEATADENDDVFEAVGCGHEERYACHRDSDDGGDVICTDGSLARATAQLKLARAKLDQSMTHVVAETRADLSRQQEVLSKLMQERIGFSVVERATGGVVVDGVKAGGPADGKLALDDAIVAIEGFRVASLLDFVMAVHTRHGRSVSFAIKHGEETRTVPIDLR